MIKRYYLFFAAFILLLRFTSYGQISTSTLTGCAPLINVTFTYTPAGTNPLWDFGDGTQSPFQNPQHTFAHVGTYTVTYSATGVSPKTTVIKVFGKPTPSFTVTSPSQGCVPLTVNFQDHSTSGGGATIKTWGWDFGDGGSSSTNSATQAYTYIVPGEFNVNIKITDSNGCDSSLTIPNMVIVSQKPTVSLVTSPNPPSACTPPLTVTFTSSGSTSHSPAGSALTYSWTFSGGASSTLATPPAQTYTALGVYPVSVVVTDANNCSNTATTNVTIQNPTAIISTNDTVCLHAVFNSTGSSPGTQTWNYGDGTTGSTGTHIYTASGTYQIKLTVTNGACSSVATQTVYVQQPIANFSVTPSYMYCKLPGTVSVVNSSTPSNGTTYQWAYYENYTQYSVTPTSYTLTSPSPTFTLSYLDTNPYTINTLDIMDSVSLWITTAQGCKSHKSFLLIDTVFIPRARFMPNKYEGCAPLTVTFSDSSSTGPRNPITFWKYNFGDGTSTTFTSSPANTVHTYTAVGIYYPTLIIHTQNNCPDTSYAIKIEVGKKPVADFSVSPTTVCIGDNVQLTNTSPTSTDSIDTWHYYGDGGYYISSCSNSPNVTWPFTHATGPQDVSLVACYRGCCDSVTKTNAVTVNGPLAEFSVAMDCSLPHVFNFTGNISDAVNWTWDFGDGNSVPNSTASSISHTYAATGDYNVVLTAFNLGNGCNRPSSYTTTVHVKDLEADFTYDALLCSKTSHNFDASISTNVYTDAHNGYIWLWGDNTHVDITPNTAISHTFSASGTYTVTLMVKDANGCSDTMKKVIKAYSTAASFITNTVMCSNSTLTFTNTSTSDTTITSSTGYYWNFGDLTTQTDTSRSQNPSYTYSISAGVTSVTVTLISTNTLSCTDTARKVISISRPSAAIHNTSSANICANSAVNFASNNGTLYPSMTWNFGDGATLGPTPPTTSTTHSYTTSGNYTVTLSVVDAVGCTDTKPANVLVNVQNIPQVFITSPAFRQSLCAPYQAHYKDNSTVNVFASRVWNTHDGTIFNNTYDSISHPYSVPGTYTISLTETTTNGCTSTADSVIKVNGPVGDFTLTPGVICKGQSITFTLIDTSNVDNWNWDFGDGTTANAISPITHIYNFHPQNNTGSTSVGLVLYSKTCSLPQSHPVSIRQVIADFVRSDSAHCLGIRDTFKNTSQGASIYGWNLGNGVTDTAYSPIYQYTVAGTYNVMLHIKDNVAGCVDTMIKKMYIYPPFTVTAIGDTICQDQLAHLSASNATTYSWTAQAGAAPLSSYSIANPTTSPSVTTTYSVTASDINGCKDDTSAVVYVIQRPDTVEDVKSIVIGQTYTLQGGQINNAGYTFAWSPTNNLSCTSCPAPVFNGTVDAHYVETISDTRGCFVAHSTFDIHIEPLASVDVPTAFTPNGDGANDIVYVDGWGIKSLQYFKIYNRWGELVFESNDIKVGWDGTYRGTPQNTETYVYQVSVITYISQDPIIKKGYIKLLR
ncbi:MAG TPA: PKD domain-containing protein [Bacteroidia bacterium]|jgi:gliding motility-associated-like protein|nr:PKD domain-containing protein [Bacteroidia bacterium]